MGLRVTPIFLAQVSQQVFSIIFIQIGKADLEWKFEELRGHVLIMFRGLVDILMGISPRQVEMQVWK